MSINHKFLSLCLWGWKKETEGGLKVIPLFLLRILLLLFVSGSIYLFQREKESKQVDQFCHPELKVQRKRAFLEWIILVLSQQHPIPSQPKCLEIVLRAEGHRELGAETERE